MLFKQFRQETRILSVVGHCPDRKSGNFHRINIVLIDEWRLLIETVIDFFIFDGPNLAAANLVVDAWLMAVQWR